MTVNFGPQHPAAHGVLRLVMELSGEVRLEGRRGWVCGFIYLHTAYKHGSFYKCTLGVCAHTCVCACVCVCVRVHVPPQYDVYLCVCASSLRQWNDVILI